MVLRGEKEMGELEKALAKMALANMLLMGMLPPKTPTEMIEIVMKGKYAEEEAKRAIAEGRLSPCEVRKKVHEMLEPLVQAERMKHDIVVYGIDEKGQIKMKKEHSEEKK